jgi:cysteinyl-tRNA synthetase
MRSFVIAIAAQVRAAAPGFLIVPQNGLELLTIDGHPDGALAEDYVAVLDGVGQEDVSFGYTADEVPTPREDHARLLSFLDRIRARGRAVVVVDYCRIPAHIEAALSLCVAHGFAGYAAPSRNLEQIASDPLQPLGASGASVDALTSARNALYLLNPERYSNRQALVAAVAATDFDVVILDAWFDVGQPLDASDVEALRSKPGGGRRLVLAYLSIGEAEDYRNDWDPLWVAHPPDWLGEENPDWPGNYAVEFWHPEWQALIASRLDGLVKAGFDGVYLDKVDAYETFETLP